MSIPICVSIVPPGMDTVRTLLQVGAERVTIALDAACKGAYQAAKGDGWERRLGFLRQAANEFPGRIGTHLIVGLGETERDMVMRLQEMMDRGVTVGLFAFTPVAGTKWGNEQPPPLDSYRRIQAVWYLLRTKGIRFGDLSFTTDGQILSYGLEEDRLRHLLASGVAFQTAGCPDCNRPYYNERPGKALFNYPRPLIAKEIEDALAAVLAGRARSLGDDRRQ
jgi:biotin synthase